MLESLDTLIAFALIFTVVSLLITIIVQMIASFLNLRGKNLAWGIAEAFEAIAPELKAEVKGKAKALADYLLVDPLISDSQIGSKVKPATAVRADELFDLLHRIAIGKKPGTPDEIKNDVVTLFKNLGVPASVFAVADAEKAKMEAFKVNLEQAVQALPAGPAKDAANTALQEANVKLANMTTDATACATRWAAQGEVAIQQVYQKFEHWFETGQERSQDWFTTHARIITAVLGLIFAFVFQLDTIEIYKLVSLNREVRDSLVAQVKPVIDQGEKILKESPTVMKASLDRLGGTSNVVVESNKSYAFSRTVEIAATDTPEKVKAKIRTAYTNTYLDTLDVVALKDIPDQEEAGKHDEYKNKLDDGFKKWLGTLTDTSFTNALRKANIVADKEAKKADFRQRVVKVLDEKLSNVLEDFDKETVKEVQARMKVSSEEWNTLKVSLDETGFDLFPKDGWRWKHEESGAPCNWMENFKSMLFSKHFFGMFFSALLLSLGAPFWFNTLKSLANLRSSVAKNISDEDKAQLKNTKADQASKAPPTVK